MLDSLVRVKTGRLKPLSQHPKRGRAELSEYRKDTKQNARHCTPNDPIAPIQPCPRAHAAKTSVPFTVSLQSYNTA